MAFKIIWMMNHKLKCSSRQGHTRQDLSAGTVLITPEQPRDTHTNPLHKAILDIPIYVHLGTPARRWVSQGHACHQDLLQNLRQTPVVSKTVRLREGLAAREELCLRHSVLLDTCFRQWLPVAEL